MPDVVVNVVLFTELAGQREAGEMLQPVPVDGVDVEPDDERREQAHVHQHGDADHDALPVLVEGPEDDVRQEGEGEQQAAEEAEDVRDVVDPRQEAAREQEEDDGQELEEGFPGVFQDLPALDELHEEARQEAELTAGGTDLQERKRY